MDTSNLLANQIGLWFLAVTSTAAAVLTVVAAARPGGDHPGGPYRFAMVMLGVATAALAASYWWAIADGLNLGQQELRRGAGFVWFPSLALSAWAGMRFSAHRNRRAQDVLDELADGRD